MNRERLQILADHLRSLPDERVDMRKFFTHGPASECGTVACIAGWASALFGDGSVYDALSADYLLTLSHEQGPALFCPPRFTSPGLYTRSDAIAAIQSMLDSPDDDALPVWPSREGVAA